jgi:hypothetical protein
MVLMKFASLILRIFHGINLDRYVRLDRLDHWDYRLIKLTRLTEFIGFAEFLIN